MANVPFSFQGKWIKVKDCPYLKKYTNCPALARGQGCPIKGKAYAAGCPLFKRNACPFLKTNKGCPFFPKVKFHFRSVHDKSMIWWWLCRSKVQKLSN